MLDQDQFSRKWSEIKGAIRNVWGDIEEEELEESQGHLWSIYKIIKKHTMESEESIQDKLQTLLNSFDNDTDKKGSLLDSASFQRKPFLH